MNIFISENAKVKLPEPSDNSTLNESKDENHYITIAQEDFKIKRNQSKMHGRAMDIYVSLYNDLQHKLIIHTNEE